MSDNWIVQNLNSALSTWNEKLAEILDVDTSFIGQIEAPNIYKPITLTTLFRIADALEMAPGELLNF